MYQAQLGQTPQEFSIFHQPTSADLFTHHEVDYINNIMPAETAVQMIHIARRSVVNPEVAGMARYLVRELIDEQDSPFASVMSEIQAIYNWVTTKLRYTRDPIGVELVYSPVQLLRLIRRYGKWAEDCDSQQLLALVMMMALGRPTRITIAGFRPDADEFFSHVFCEVLVPGIPGFLPTRWVIVDPALRDKVHEMAPKITTVRFFYPHGQGPNGK